MAGKKKSWRAKLADSKYLPKVVKITGKLVRTWGEGTAAIAAPKDIDALMKKARKGKLLTMSQMCQYIAKEHGADVGCPMTTGIFAWIAAHAADESEREGRKRITPYWRTLKASGELNQKYPGGIDNVRCRLEAEGHTVIQRGKRFFVEDYEKKLAKLG